MNRFNDPQFTLPEAIRATGVERKTIENWMVHGHIAPSLDAQGRDRRFSLWDMLEIVVMHRLRDPFNVQAKTAAHLARDFVNTYSARADRDMADIEMGRPIGETDYRPATSLRRDDNGELRAFRESESLIDDVMIVVPVGLLARNLFAKAKALREQPAQ
jgi:hypothetical protein